jgi:redox-sensing transcriptional repressor
MNKLPQKTVERLSQYRRLLMRYRYLDKPHIFSKDLARLLRINSVHVRRDLMLLGVSGSHSKGYDVQKLIVRITERLECEKGKNACIIGFGHTGRAVLEILAGDFTPVNVKAIFDTSNKSIGHTFHGVPCHSMGKIAGVIEDENITLAILADMDEDPENYISLLSSLGIKGIMNLTPAHLNLPDNIHLEEYDLVTALIKLAYFSGIKASG